MKIPPPGNHGNGKVLNFGGARRKMTQDPRIPKLPGDYTIFHVPFDIQKNYLLSVVAPNVGEAKSFEDLGKLAIGWTEELFAFKPEYKAYYNVAVLLKKPEGLKVLASREPINPQELGLNEPGSVVSWVMKKRATVYLPSLFKKFKFGEYDTVGDYAVLSLGEKREEEGLSVTQAGIDVTLLRDKIGEKAPCFLVSPLIFKDEVFGVLFQAIGIPEILYGVEIINMLIAAELASNLALGVKLLQEKGFNF
jgi:hypothetical protein